MEPVSERATLLFPAITQTLRVAPIKLEHKLLLWLLRYPFQRAEDLALALEVNQSTIQRHLMQHQEAGRVEAVTPSLGRGNPVRCYHLTHQGLLAAAQHEQTEPGLLAQRWQADERGLLRLLPRIHQLLRLQDVINSLVVTSPMVLAPPGKRAAAIHWHWRRDYQHQFVSQQRTMRCRADAALVLQRLADPAQPSSEPSCYSLLVIVEGAIELDARIIRQRVDAFLRYRESRERVPFYPHFPPLLVVVSSQHQRAVWQRCALEAAVTRRIKPLVGAVVVCPTQESPTSVWSWPWQQLSASGPCRLPTLLTAMPREAILAEIMPPYHTPSPAKAVNRAQLVRGKLMQRAKDSLRPTISSPYYEREAVALLSLHLSPRHLALLRLLYTYPFLSYAELAAVAGMREETIRRYALDLSAKGCITCIEGNQETRLLVSERGLHFVAAVQRVRMQWLTEQEANGGGRVQCGVGMLQRHMYHTTGIYTFFRILSQTAQNQQHHVLWFETGRQSERSYRTHGVWHNIRPDAAFAYRTDQQRLVAWLEWDEGSMTMRNLAAKLYEYQRVIRGREWVSYDSRVLPVLLFVVPDKGQEARVVKVARAILGNDGITIRTTTATRLTTYGPLAAIWFQATPPLPSGTPRSSLLHSSQEGVQTYGKSATA